MRTICTVFKTIALLVAIGDLARADDGLSPAGQTSLNCFIEGGAGVKTMFTNTNGECKCDVATAPAQGGWSRCPTPSDPSYGFAICTPGAGCTQNCFHNAPMNAQGQCTPFPLAEEPGMITMTDSICTEPGQVIGAYTAAGCQCDAPRWHETRGGQVCRKDLPENSIATCLRSAAEVGDSYCGFQCKPGFEKADNQCVTKTTNPDSDNGRGNESSGNTNAPGEDTNRPTGDLAEACPDPFNMSFSSPSGKCGCVYSVKMAKKRKPDAAMCLPPSANGKVGCKNVGTASQCTVDCDSGYKPSADEKECVPARQNTTISELECMADSGAVGFLTADPDEGCVCKSDRTDNFCGVAVGDPDAEMMCSDTTDATGRREVKCAPQCTEGYIIKDKNTCEMAEVEAESITLAGTGTPRDAFETRCTQKVFKLPGQRGCQCAASPPEGAQECRGAGENEYVVCRYRKGSGKVAACSKNCVQGTYPDEDNKCT